MVLCLLGHIWVVAILRSVIKKVKNSPRGQVLQLVFGHGGHMSRHELDSRAHVLCHVSGCLDMGIY
jgi:hypothetical protein